VLLTNIILSFIFNQPFRKTKWQNWYFAILTQFLFFPAIAAVGAAGWVNFRVAEVNPLSMYSQLFLNILSFVIGIFFIIKMKGLRWFAISIFLFCQWMLIGINMMTTMAITGVWI